MVVERENTMKQTDVHLNEQYYTKVGNDLVKVEIVRKVDGFAYLSSRKQTRFVVKRVDNGNILPKSRTAMALRK